MEPLAGTGSAWSVSPSARARRLGDGRGAEAPEAAGRGQRLDGAVAHEGAVFHDGDARADALDLAEEVRVEEERDAFGGELQQEVADLAAADGVDAVGRLVEEHEARARHERLRDAEPLHHALRERLDLAVGGTREADLLQEAAGARVVRAGHAREEVEGLARGEVVREAVVLGEEADRPPRQRLADGDAEDLPLALGRVDDPEQQLDERRLARAVGAEEAEDLAGLDARDRWGGGRRRAAVRSRSWRGVGSGSRAQRGRG